MQLKQIGAGVAVLAALGWSTPAFSQNTIPLSYVEKTGQDNPFDTISTNPVNIHFVDLDGDGDKDMITRNSSLQSGRIVWNLDYYKNTGTPTLPRFELQVGSTKLDTINIHAVALEFVDIDGDGDLDLFASQENYYTGDSTIHLKYYRNEAANPGDDPIFSLVPATSNPLQKAVDYYDSLNLHRDLGLYTNFLDVDNDGDLDCFVGAGFAFLPAAHSDKRIVYYKNIGSPSSPNFQLQSTANNPLNIINTILPIQGTFLRSLEFFDGDLIRDGIIDAFFTSTTSGGIRHHYFKNTGVVGAPNFIHSTTMPVDSIHLKNPTLLHKHLRRIVDLTNDGRSEIIVVKDSKIRYFVDTVSYLSASTIAAAKPLDVYPNPSTGVVQFGQTTTGKLNVYNNIGQLLYAKELDQVSSVDVNFLKTGSYIFYLQTPKENYLQKVTIIQP